MTSHEKRTSTTTATAEHEALRRSEFLLAVLLAILSVAALLWYYAHNELLLYGDAVAHINIARRVIDNRSWLSSFFQLGTVWLPLQHVAMLPFVWNNRLWQSGIAGSIPSMVAYVLGGLGIFRLVSGFTPTLSQNRGKDGSHPALRPGAGWGTHTDGAAGLRGDRDLRVQSQPALHAGDRDERADLSGVLHLGAGLSRQMLRADATEESRTKLGEPVTRASPGALRNLSWLEAHGRATTDGSPGR